MPPASKSQLGLRVPCTPSMRNFAHMFRRLATHTAVHTGSDIRVCRVCGRAAGDIHRNHAVQVLHRLVRMHLLCSEGGLQGSAACYMIVCDDITM